MIVLIILYFKKYISTRILIQNIIHVNNMKSINLRNHNEPYFSMLCNKYYNYLNNYCSLLHLALLGKHVFHSLKGTTFNICQMIIQYKRWIYVTHFFAM